MKKERMNSDLLAMLAQVIEEYHAAHPEEAAEADRQCRDHKPFSEVEPEIFSITAPDENKQKGEENT